MLTLYAKRVLLDGVLQPATVVIDGERIAAVRGGPAAKDSAAAIEDKVTALDDDTVLVPALTDVHVHLNEPGRTEWEGLATGTRAAAKGGITTLVDMPLNCIPVTTTAGALEVKLAAARRAALHVDVGFWGGVIPGNTAELEPMVRLGAFGFKCFTCPSGINEFPPSSERDVLDAMQVLARLGVPLLVHAELELDGPSADAPTAGEASSYLRYLHSRPRAWEDAAVAMVIRSVRATGCRAHIVHLSSASALPMIRAAKAEGLPISCETCPHYLVLCAEEIPDGATEYKCAPPIRERDNREALWAGLINGTIDFVSSDHSPCTPALKLRESGDFERAWGGIASVQLGLPNIWTAARARGVPLEQVLDWMSSRPGEALGRPHRIAAGQPANLVAFKPNAAHTIAASDLLFRHPLTPYIGRTVTGVVSATWLRGAPVTSTSTPGGRILRRFESP
ncbi:MAG: allantoinase AllB [Myxococcales bacterium]|nr:allantoinase AllB [Myxococcales bacterium]